MPPGAAEEVIVSVSAGAFHVAVTTQSGNVFAWGVASHAGIVEEDV